MKSSLLLPAQLMLYVLISFTQVASADETLVKPLTKPLILSFIKVSNQMTQLGSESPELVAYLSALHNQNKVVSPKQLTGLSIFPELQKAIEQSEFASVKDIFFFSKRIAGIAYYSKMQSSEQANIFQTVNTLQANINTMKANSAAKETIERAESVLAQQRAKAAMIKKNLELVTENDKRFLERNMDWLNQQFMGL
jgi:DNA-directed RNA polymerase sigma subunit (sigma70/sigma32)